MHLFYYRRRGAENKGGLVSQLTRIVGVAGVMVSIVAFQAVDPGSIPGPRSLFTWGNSQHKGYVVCLLSLVVEHSLCKRKVGGSIPPVGCCIFCPGSRCDRDREQKRY